VHHFEPSLLLRSISYFLLFSYLLLAFALIVCSERGLLAHGRVWLLGSSLGYVLGLEVSRSAYYDATRVDRYRF
jgi:hypothetical protein